MASSTNGLLSYVAAGLTGMLVAYVILSGRVGFLAPDAGQPQVTGAAVAVAGEYNSDYELKIIGNVVAITGNPKYATTMVESRIDPEEGIVWEERIRAVKDGYESEGVMVKRDYPVTIQGKKAHNFEILKQSYGKDVLSYCTLVHVESGSSILAVCTVGDPANEDKFIQQHYRILDAVELT